METVASKVLMCVFEGKTAYRSIPLAPRLQGSHSKSKKKQGDQKKQERQR